MPSQDYQSQGQVQEEVEKPISVGRGGFGAENGPGYKQGLELRVISSTGGFPILMGSKKKNATKRKFEFFLSLMSRVYRENQKNHPIPQFSGSHCIRALHLIDVRRIVVSKAIFTG